MSAKIFTDKRRGYSPLKAKYNIEQKESENGKNFKEIHIVIHQIKSWIRTVPTHICKKHLQSYFDEFTFKINRSIFNETIFHKKIKE